ncbi:MAG: MFS transporter, partial [Acidimicrobiia bacterium]|nr:MFS transporter [Acidimicrobiia bacterium]
MKHLTALFLSMCLIGLGSGLGTSLLGIRSTIEGFSDLQTGLALSGFYVGFLAGSRFVGNLLANVGHIRVFAGLAALISSVILVHSLLLNPPAWFVLRFAAGFCMSGIYITADSWLNNQVNNQNRGRILGIYMMMGMGGAAAGQLLIGFADPGGFTLFILASMAFSLSLVPLSLTRIDPPAIPPRKKADIRAVYGAAPLAIVGAAAAGFTQGSVLTMGPVYGTEVGLAGTRIGWMMGALMLGSTAMIPLGRLSDRIPRRRVILAITVVAIGLCLLMSFGPIDPAGLAGVMLAYGALIFPVYALAMSHMNDLLERSQLVPGMAALVTFMAFGAITGPVTTSAMMTLLGPDGMWLSLAAAHSLFALYIVNRFVRRPHIPPALQRVFVPITMRSSARVAYLIRSRRRKNRPGGGPPPVVQPKRTH